MKYAINLKDITVQVWQAYSQETVKCEVKSQLTPHRLVVYDYEQTETIKLIWTRRVAMKLATRLFAHDWSRLSNMQSIHPWSTPTLFLFLPLFHIH